MVKPAGASLVRSQSTPLVLESDFLEGQVQAILHRSKTFKGWESQTNNTMCPNIFACSGHPPMCEDRSYTTFVSVQNMAN